MASKPEDQIIDDNWGLPTEGVPVKSGQRAIAPEVERVIQTGTEIARGTQKPKSDLEIELIDDRPPQDRKAPRDPKVAPYDVTDDELAQYSEGVQARIKKLRFEFHEERRAKESADRERTEAVRVAQAYMAETQRLQNEHVQLQSQLQQRNVYAATAQKSRLDAEMSQARAAMVQAQEAGDAGKMAAAQELLARAASQSEMVKAYEASLPQAQPQQQQIQQQAQWQQPQGQPNGQWQQSPQQNQLPQYQQQASPQAEIDPKAVNWLRANPWFGNDKDEEALEMTGYAYGVHERLVKARIDPRSDEYYSQVNAAMRKRFPEKFDDGNSRTEPRPQIVAAPSRSSGAVRKVQLTQTQAALAKRLGLTLEQYAEQILKEQKNG